MASQVVASIMSVPTVCITPAMRASEALSLAHEHKIHHLPVVEEGIAVGLVCTCDLEDAAPNDTVSASMRRPPIATRPDATWKEALDLMNARGVGSLLVVAGGELLGVVTRKDEERAGVPMRDDPRGYCSCCGDLEHLRPHVTGALCVDCFERSKSGAVFDTGGGD